MDDTQSYNDENNGGDHSEPGGLRVTVDEVVYQPGFQSDSGRPYCFVYYITIHNDTGGPVTIKGRKWVVTNGRGEFTVVEGSGVVGEFPRIETGQRFSYNSFHLLETPIGMAEGSYLGVDGNGRKVVTRIPPFRMRAEPQGDFA